jgi:hypothetical protein
VTRLAPADELNLALATAGSFVTAIQHADTKAAILLAVEVSLVSAVFTGTAGPDLTRTGPASHGPAILFAATLLCGAVGALVHLGACVWPRLRAPGSGNRFGFPTLLAVPEVTQVSGQLEEAWRLATVLAGIARAKHRSIRRSMPWIAVSALAVLARGVLANVGLI